MYKGVGIGMFILAFFIGIHQSVFLSYSMNYFIDSWSNPLPWVANKEYFVNTLLQLPQTADNQAPELEGLNQRVFMTYTMGLSLVFVFGMRGVPSLKVLCVFTTVLSTLFLSLLLIK